MNPIFKRQANRLYRKIFSLVEYTTRTPASYNEVMDLEQAHGIIVVNNYPTKGQFTNIPFQVEDPAKLEYPSTRLVKDLIKQAWLLGYEVRSVEFLVGNRKNIPYLFDTYFMVNPVWTEEHDEVNGCVKAIPMNQADDVHPAVL